MNERARGLFDKGWTPGHTEYMIRFGAFCWFFSKKDIVNFRYFPRSMFEGLDDD